jgi:hypothetical protein
MPTLIWDPYDLFNVLGVIPSEGESGTSHRYVIEQDCVKLQLTVWQFEADVEIKLWAAPLPDPVIRYTMLGCPGVRVVDDKRGRFLEFAAANTFTGRYDGYSVIPYGLRLWVTPQIFLEPFTNSA